ncbi:MAG: hypothetical protein AAGU12_14085 [Clostridiales bacterium]
MLKATIVGGYNAPSKMLQRRIGGILKDIASVEICLFDELDKNESDIYIAYSHGIRYEKLRTKFRSENKKLIAAELTLLPIGIRMLKAIKKGSRVGVVAEHLRCANYFLGEILKAGVLDYHFLAGKITDMKRMNVDVFAIPEELLDLADESALQGKNVLPIPRTITASCYADLINAAMEN